MSNRQASNSSERDRAPAIDLNGVSVDFGTNRRAIRLQVLEDLSFSVRSGEFVSLVGPSGCGKTTLLRLLAGLLLPGRDGSRLSGSVGIFGMTPAEAKRRRTFAFTFQNPALLPWRTVRQNVELPLELAQASISDARPEVVDMLETTGLADFSHWLPSQLSGGMRQRANLARALIQRPRVLLMDEPFGSLDEVTRERLNFELLRLHRIRKFTVIFVTHSLTEAVLLANRVIVMTHRPGRIHAEVEVNLGTERSEDTLLTPGFHDSVRQLRSAFRAIKDPR